MTTYDYTGVVELVGETKEFGTNGFTKRDLVVGNDVDSMNKYPNPVLFTFKKDRCALCDDTHGLQIHHIVHRSCGGNDTPCNLITLCWRCHAEAHGTWLNERHVNALPSDAAARWAVLQSMIDDYEQMCVEYVSDYYRERGDEWWPYK